jgi:acyl dehydratase
MTATRFDWTVGEQLPPRDFGPVTTTDIVRYQGASGDMNPMHHDDVLARSAGYPEAFSVGMLSAGYLATYCTDFFGTESVRRFRTRFREIVWRGDVLTMTGTISEVRPVVGGVRITVDLQVTTQTGKCAVQGLGEFELAGRLGAGPSS